MPTYKVTDPTTGKTVSLTGDSAPTEQELEEVFSQINNKTEVPEKGFLRKTAEAVIDSPAFPMVGGIMGAIAGAPSGPGAVGAAALGGAGGEAIRQLAARSIGMDSPSTATQAAKKIAIEGGVQGASEAIGSGVIAPAAKAIGKVVAKPAGDLFQIITKMKPQDAATLFKNPKAILPGQWTKAQAAWKTAAKEIGLPVDEISPEMIKILEGDAKKMVFETYGKLIAGEAVSAKDAQLAKQAIDIAIMPVAKTVRKNPLVNTLSQIRQEFSKRIGEESPKMAAANKQYGIAATGKKFQSIFPRNTTGDPAYIRSTILPSILFGIGFGKGEPGKGALAGAGTAMATSPLAIGSLIALAGGARNATQTISPHLRRTVVSGLSELAKKKFNWE